MTVRSASSSSETSPRSSLSELNPLFAGKRRPPLLPRPHLARPRLLTVLRRAVRRRVSTVIAPAGAGKTILLAEWGRSATGGAWYTVDDLDSDALTLLHGIAGAVGADAPQSLDRLGYLARIVAALDSPRDSRQLVIDDVHRLTDPTAIAALADLLRHLPASARVILAGRSLPPRLTTILDWLAAQGQLGSLSWEDFQLEDDERSRAAVVFNTPPAGAWILAWTHLPSFNLSRYLQNEVLTPLGLETIERLARLAVPSSLTGALAAAIENRPVAVSRRFLDEMARETPLLERLGDDSYRFSETARDVLASNLSPEVLGDARRAVGSALRTIDPLASAESFLQAGDQDSAAASLTHLPLADWLVQAANSAHRCLEQLPLEVVERDPRLRLARAWAAVTWHGQIKQATDLLGNMLPSPNDPVTAFWCYYVLARAWLALGQRPSATSALQILKALLEQIRRTPGNDLAVTASMLCRLAMIERLLGERDTARATAERGLALAELNAAATKAERQILRHALGTFAGWDGDYAAASEHFEAALILASETGDVALGAVLTNAQAGIARCRGESSRALGMLEQALREPLMPARERAFLTLQTAHVFADLEDFPDAAKHYRLASSMLSGNDRDGVFARALAGFAVSSRFLGLDAEADAILEQLRPIADGPSRYDLHLAEGLRAMHNGELAEAILQFAAARQIPNTLGGSQDTWQAILLEAQAHLRSDRIDAAEQTVTAYLQSPGATAPAVGQWVMRPMRDCLVNLQRRLNHPGLAALLCQTTVDRRAPRVVHVAKVLDQTQQTAVHRFEIHLFGRPEIVVDDEIVSWPSGLRRKAVELFWYSAVHLDGFTREQAIADLFPDRDPDAGRKLFLVSAADLRSALGQFLGIAGDTIFVREASGTYRLRLDLSPLAIDLDVKSLSNLAGELRNRRGEPPPRDVPSFFRGDLLAGLDAEWVDPIRRYWTSLYLRTLETLAVRYSRQGLLQHAIRCLELALQVDSTLESAHATLMRLYQAAGDRPALDSQMWLYTRTVRSELDTEPSEEILSLYRQLTSKDERL